jgi:hypothetical protein
MTGAKCKIFSTINIYTVARTWRLYKTGYWIDKWIYWITHSYSVHTLQLTAVDHNTRLATAPQPVSLHCLLLAESSLFSQLPTQH